MVDRTSISWTDSTWNPTEGCEMCSPGCANCYAMAIAGRFSGRGGHYEGLVRIGKDKKARWNGKGRLVVDALAKPLRWRAPRRVFVDSMSDLFFEKFADDEIAAVFGVMAASPRHQYQVLTKRAERAREWFEWIDGGADDAAELCRQHADMYLTEAGLSMQQRDRLGIFSTPEAWPLPNVWLGVSVDDREHGLPRINELRDVKAAVRFLSIEPLLEDLGRIDLRGIDWVIAGCESGREARECSIDWLRSIRDQCADAKVAFFLKQAVDIRTWETIRQNGRGISFGPGSKAKGVARRASVIERPYLDGAQHLAFPEVRRG